MLSPSASITNMLTPLGPSATGRQTEEVPTGQRGGGRGLRRWNKAESGKGWRGKRGEKKADSRHLILSEFHPFAEGLKLSPHTVHRGGGCQCWEINAVGMDLGQEDTRWHPWLPQMASVASCTESDGNSSLGERALLCKEEGRGSKIRPQWP